MKGATDARFLAAWLCAAAVVVVLRFLLAAAVGYDLGIQIQVAHNLLAGKGLTFYQHAAANLTDPAGLITLTHFPSGYSLCAAALMAVGLSVGMVVKLLGAAATILGWWGWGRLAYPFFREGLTRSSRWKWAGFVIATSTPLLFTPPWGGTDIFLWATVPWVVVCVVRASDENVPGARWLDGVAGALCGLSLLMRYASLFLAAYAACVILWQSGLRVRILTRRWIVFGLGVLPALAFQVYVDYFLSNSPATPGGLSSHVALGAAVRRLWDGVRLLHTANYVWAFWVPGKILNLLFPEAVGAWPWQLGLTVIGFIVLALAVTAYGHDRRAASRDYGTAALGLFAAVLVTLFASMMLSPYDYVGDLRYYWSIGPLSIFVVYSIASLIDLPRTKGLLRLLQTCCVLYLIGYIGMSLVYILFLFVPGTIGTSQRDKLMASDLHHWPSMAVTSEFSSARQCVMRLLSEQPDTLLLTSRVGWFSWDPAVDRSRVYDLKCGGLPATYVRGPARIVILTFDGGQPQELWFYVGNDIHGSAGRADCFERFSDLNVVQRFPEEGLKVLEARVDAGRHIVLKP